MKYSSQKGVVQILALFILLAGIVAGVYLVLEGPKIFKSGAFELNTVDSFDYSDIRAVALTDQWYSDSFETTLQKVKEAGYNSVWLILPWTSFNPKPLASPPVYNDSKFAILKRDLDLIRANDMKVILPLNYFGAGWAPEGISPTCGWVYNSAFYNSFEVYVKEFLTRIRDYHDISYVVLFAEGTEDCETLKNVTYSQEPYASRHAAKLTETLGSLPERLPADLRRDFKFGFHDWFYLPSLGINPTVPGVYDFYSFSAYGVGKKTINELNQLLSDVTGKIRSVYPSIPIIEGELGSGTCATYGDSEDTQANGLVAAVNYHLRNRQGFVIWPWQDWKEDICVDPNSDSHAGIVKFDGTPKKAVAALQNIFNNLPAHPTATLTSDKATINLGESFTLSWSSTQATSCTTYSTPHMSNFDWDKRVATSGSVIITPAEAGNHTFSLICNGPAGSTDPNSPHSSLVIKVQYKRHVAK